MKKILIVEDDKVVSSIYRNKLQNEGYEVDVAGDGDTAIVSIVATPPDLVLLDLGLPKINGVEVLKRIRGNTATAKLPVIVLSNSYVTALVQAAWKAGANKCLSKSESSPRLIANAIHGLLAISENGIGSDAGIRNAQAVQSSQAWPASTDAVFQSQVRLSLLNSAPGFVNDLRKHLKILAQAGDRERLPADLFDFYRVVHSLTGHAGSAGFVQIANLCAALEGLIKELHEKPNKIGASPIRTAAQAIDALARLFGDARQPQSELQRSPLVLVLDDDVIARKTLCAALDKAQIRFVSVDSPTVAFNLLEENVFDLVFSDVEMPGMNGFEFCEKVRGLPQHKSTPLVFVTSLADFESRARSTLSGGTDLIAKPFLLVELAVKALTYLRGIRAEAPSP